MTTIQVVWVEPGKSARIAEVGTSLKDLQKVVGGTIEVYYPFEDDCCIVCCDEGKINGMKPCRAIFDEDHRMLDIIFGPFLICACSGEEFASLSPEQQEQYRQRFCDPERFYRINGQIEVRSCKEKTSNEAE